MTKRYKVELFCKIVAFHEMEVEADTPALARDAALRDARQLGTHDWDLERVEDVELNCAPVEMEEAS